MSLNPGWHALSRSQHAWHVFEWQVGARATPAWALQYFPVPQLTQAAPAAPQNESRSPGRHTVPSQQPVGQVFALHTGGGGVAHEPPVKPPSGALHVSLFEVQSTHRMPPVPHAAESLPWRHVLPAQQPV